VPHAEREHTVQSVSFAPSRMGIASVDQRLHIQFPRRDAVGVQPGFPALGAARS